MLKSNDKFLLILYNEDTDDKVKKVVGIMEDKNKTEVRIHGKEYMIKGEESEEYMQKVANYIDKKMAEVSKNSVRMSAAATAILTAVNVADDYFKLQQSVADMKRDLEVKTKDVEAYKDEINKLKMKNTQTQLELAKVKSELEKNKTDNKRA